jgi:hypothetical protein
MNRLVTLLALAIGLGAPASAGIVNPYGALGVNNTDVVAGQVSGSGVIERGSGFRVHRDEAGAYEIKFDKRYFPSGCAAMVVSPSSAVSPIVVQNHCGGVFDVFFYLNNRLTGAGFQFIAREDAPQNP